MATEAEQRDAVEAEALTWLGTPYHPAAAVRGQGADCGLFPLKVYAALGLCPDLPVAGYSPQWSIHQQAERYLEFVRTYAGEIDRERLGKGDFVVWKFGRTYSHGAIVLGPPAIIHATIRGRCVHLGDMDRDDDLPGREALYFSPWAPVE